MVVHWPGSRSKYLLLALAWTMGCNSLWGLDDLTYQDGWGGAGASLGGAGEGGLAGHGAAGGQGASGGGVAGGGGGCLPDAGPDAADDAGWVEQSWSLGERPGADVTGVTRDTAITSSAPANNRGGSNGFGPDADPLRAGLLRFDLVALPAEAVVTGVELELFVQVCSG
ncbi:MAG: hypothetical protein DRI90_09120, partial [Deltaproteobacteria bacterium]